MAGTVMPRPICTTDRDHPVSAAERQSWASTAAAQEKERTSRGVPSRQKRVPGKRLDGNKDMRFKDNRSDLPYGENADGTPDMRLTTNRKKKK